jgi:hypothetical protein
MLDRIEKMARQGKKLREIAKAVGLHESNVSRKLAGMPAHDRSPRLVGLAVMKKYVTPWGAMTDIAATLTDDQLVWLMNQVPGGGTVSDVLYALVVDAYFEERGDE